MTNNSISYMFPSTLNPEDFHRRIQEIENKEKRENLRKNIWNTSKEINETLEKMFGCTRTVKKVCRYLPLFLVLKLPKSVLAANNTNVQTMRKAFEQILTIATAIAEPILWFYAVTALIMMATGKNKMMGKERLKSVIYSYIGITMLPTLFSFLRWVSQVLKGAFSF